MTEQEFYAHLDQLMPFGVYDHDISTLCKELQLTRQEVAGFLTCMKKYTVRLDFPEGSWEIWLEKE